MAKVWIGTYQTPIWDTPDGRLGASYYGMAGSGHDGSDRYCLEISESKKPLNHVGDLYVTANARDIQGLTLAHIAGASVLSDFINDSNGKISHKQDTQEKLDRLRTVKGEDKPIDDSGIAKANR